jgi:hypothetical protein
MVIRRIISILLPSSLFTFLIVSTLPAQRTEQPFSQHFEEGCCLNRTFPRPVEVTRSTINEVRLKEALNCATNNWLVGGSHILAKSLGDSKFLRVAYYFGKYMPEQEGKALTIAVYSVHGQDGVLFDIDIDSRKYYVENLPTLLRGPTQWHVGEINGGLWSYTRLWYLAQEIGSRPRITIPVTQIDISKPESCYVMFDDQTNWASSKGKFVGKPKPQAIQSK